MFRHITTLLGILKGYIGSKFKARGGGSTDFAPILELPSRDSAGFTGSDEYNE